MNVTVCDFGAPENCVKAEPTYKGAPAEYECGVSDERVKETDAGASPSPASPTTTAT